MVAKNVFVLLKKGKESIMNGWKYKVLNNSFSLYFVEIFM